MSTIRAFALMTLKGLTRRRTFWGIALVTLIALAGIGSIPSYDVTGEGRFMIDMGLFGIEIGSLLLAIGLASNMFPRDRESRSVMPLLAVPLSRTQYVLGRFAGAALVQTAAIMVWCACLGLILAVNGYYVPEAMLPASILLVAEGWFLLAVVLFFSFWTSPPLNAPLTLLLFIVCQMTPAQFSGLLPGAERVMEALRMLLPRMDVFHIKDPVAHRIPVPTAYFLLASVYGLAYTSFMLSLAIAVFRRRDLK
ncbi:MAG TPA: ABC transporter permease [Candidatus Fermentibacter sp.]|nr:ABC transporter permease [Candidatus Fermentibacter sp.]